eukprot:3868372-Rhodomonas_salina.2
MEGKRCFRWWLVVMDLTTWSAGCVGWGSGLCPSLSVVRKALPAILHPQLSVCAQLAYKARARCIILVQTMTLDPMTGSPCCTRQLLEAAGSSRPPHALDGSCPQAVELALLRKAAARG